MTISYCCSDRYSQTAQERLKHIFSPSSWIVEPYKRARGSVMDLILENPFLVLFEDVAPIYQQDLKNTEYGGYISMDAGPVPGIIFVRHKGTKDILQRILLTVLDQNRFSQAMKNAANWILSEHEKVKMHQYRTREGSSTRMDCDPPPDVELLYIPVLRNGNKETVPVRLYGIPRPGELSYRFLRDLTDRLAIVGHADGMDWAEAFRNSAKQEPQQG